MKLSFVRQIDSVRVACAKVALFHSILDFNLVIEAFSRQILKHLTCAFLLWILPFSASKMNLLVSNENYMYKYRFWENFYTNHYLARHGKEPTRTGHTNPQQETKLCAMNTATNLDYFVNCLVNKMQLYTTNLHNTELAGFLWGYGLSYKLEMFELLRKLGCCAKFWILILKSRAVER